MVSSDRTKMVVNYLIENKDAFSEQEIKLILSNLGEYGSLPNILLQVYDELGILPDFMNPYKAFSELINKQFDIKDKNIVEIGGGTIPRLAIRLSDMQNRGSITVYDPNLYIKKTYPNMKLIKRNFYPISNVDNADLLVGLLPCGASASILKSSIRHDKDFMIALCDSCNFYEYFDGYEEDSNWPYSFIDAATKAVDESNLGKLKVKYLKEVGERYPIIYNVRG